MSAGKPWSENEKVSFLVQAIQALSGSSGFPYDSVSLPGRTKRSMMHAWTSARAQHTAFTTQSPSDDDPAAAPSPVRSKRFKKRMHPYLDADDELIDGGKLDVKRPKKKKKAPPSPTPSKHSMEAADDEPAKIKGEPQSSAEESTSKLANGEA
ncbi:hypothetical protein F4805DRAFT_413663 [Annulohypoxylon moriforme]|nr:hypothetical protein F4805DRAFT_413663 [Annulohypoxylon moriforme]